MLEAVPVLVPELLDLFSVSVLLFPLPVLVPDLLLDPEPERSIPSVTVSVLS